MGKFLKRYFLLIISLLLFVLILLLYFPYFPFSLSQYIQNEKLQSLIITFCIGFILSSLFHFIVNVIPQNHKKRKIRRGIDEELKDIEKYMM